MPRNIPPYLFDSMMACSRKLFNAAQDGDLEYANATITDTISTLSFLLKTTGYDHPRPVDSNVVIVSKNAKSTSRKAAERVEPKSGSIRARVYGYFQGLKGFGATDDEAQAYLGIDGNTFRPTRKSLVDDGYLIDSGGTRKNENGNDCIVWIDSKHAEEAGLFL